MDSTELLKKVRKIEIKTRSLSHDIFTGQFHSAFKGRGMAFSEVREYQIGDDIRSIDWNVTARFNHPYVKIFDEERELTVMLLIDVSGSNEFGTRKQLKEELITELAAVLAFSAIQNNDKVGVIFFSDIIEKFIPPKKGTSHILRIIRELLTFKPQHRKTNITEALRYFTNVIKKRSVAFLISDFFDSGFDDALKIAHRKHDLIAMKIYDDREIKLPEVGLIQVKNAETGKIVWADTSDMQTRNNYYKSWINHEVYLKDFCKKNGVDLVSIRPDEDYVRPLINMFKQRGSR
jgi:uncharacterized protein (DUF58 family)